MEELTKEEQERLGLYTHRFKALWDRYFWLKEGHEHRKATIGLEETPEEKAMRLDYIELRRNSPGTRKKTQPMNNLKGVIWEKLKDGIRKYLFARKKLLTTRRNHVRSDSI